MNFEIIHPKTEEFFSTAKRPLEIVALAVSGRYPRDITEYLKQVLKPSDVVSNYLLNIDNIVKSYMEPVRKHNKRMGDLGGRRAQEQRNRDAGRPSTCVR